MTRDEALQLLSRPGLRVFLFDGRDIHGGVPNPGKVLSPGFVIQVSGDGWRVGGTHITDFHSVTTLEAAVDIVLQMYKKAGID